MSVLDIDDSTVDDEVESDAAAWLDVGAFDDLAPNRGVCTLVNGAPVAVFRCLPDDELFAISNIDPFSDASVMSRGIVGSIGDRRVVASPMYKNRFDLETGESLDDPSIKLLRWGVRVERGRVLVKALPYPREINQQ